MVFVLILPVAACLLWFGAFGGAALHQHIVEGYTGVTENVEAWKLEIALFKMFDELPLGTLLSSFAILLTVLFFVTSSDSGSLILDTIAAGGRVDAPVAQRVFWCTIEGLVAIALLLGGGLNSLQAASLVSGFRSPWSCWEWRSASGRGFAANCANPADQQRKTREWLVEGSIWGNRCPGPGPWAWSGERMTGMGPTQYPAAWAPLIGGD